MLIRFRFFLLSVFSFALCAQDTQPQIDPQLDILTFKNGERLAGHFVRSDGSYVIFNSESVGEVTVYWSQIEDLQSSQTFAVIEKNMKLRKGEDPKKFPQGTLSVKEDNLVVRSPEGPEEIIAISDTSHVVDQSTFERSVSQEPGLLEAWRGTITGGVSVVEGTQTSRTYTTAINLVRAIPLESWQNRRQRTILNLNGAYGNLKQPDTPKLQTQIFHGDLEHDVYFTTRFFAFGQTSFDHNLSQGLSLAQNYGGGIGWTVLKNEASEIDLRSSLTYIKQQFADPAQNQNLIGSIFAQSFTRRFSRNIRITQHLTATPAWNNLRVYSATGDVTLTVPVYRRLMFSLSILNTFINNPSPGYQKNSFQAATGLTYSLP